MKTQTTQDTYVSEQTWKDYLASQISESNNANLQTSLDEFIDESRSSLKLLLPDISNARILYVGNNSDGTALNLARSCKSVNAYYLSQESFKHQSKKLSLKDNIDNIEIDKLLYSQAEPFGNFMFDGAVIDMSLESLSEIEDKPFQTNTDLKDWLIKQIHKSLSNNGWVFLKAENALNRNYFLHQLKNLVKAILLRKSQHQSDKSMIAARGLASVGRYQKLLNQNDLILHKVYSFDQPDIATDTLIDLSKNKQIQNFVAKERFKHIPHWLYRLTIPCVGLLASKSAEHVPIATIKAIIEQVANSLSIEDYSVASVEVNRKCKLILSLEAKNEKIAVKIPLTDLADKHLAHSYKGLQLLKEQRSSVEDNSARNTSVENTSVKNKSILACFSQPLIKGKINNTSFYAESYVNGLPFTKKHPEIHNKTLVKVLMEFTVDWINLDKPKPSKDQFTETLLDQVSFLRQLIARFSIEERQAFEKIVSHLSPAMAPETAANYFYKSDFTTSNILVENQEVSGIIDMDFWGYSHNRLVDYADFIMSYSRSVHAIDYAKALSILISADYHKLPSILVIGKTLENLNASHEELSEAAIIAWINSISHALEFERIQLNQEKVKAIFTRPALSISKLIVS